jgi:hypothetical protein
LFGKAVPGKEVVAKLRPQAPSQQRLFLIATECNYVDVCYGPDDIEWCNGECYMNCEYYTHTELECTEIWFDDGFPPGGPGGTGGQGGTGGSGGSGGGATPPQCNGSNPARTSVISPCGPGWIPPEVGFPDILDQVPPFNGIGHKPIAEFSMANKCQELQYMWNNYPDNEVVGFMTADGKLIVTEVQSYDGGPINGIKRHITLNDTSYYFSYPRSQGPPSLSYEGMQITPAEYLIPIIATIHTHTPCRDDGTNGVSDQVSVPDKGIAHDVPQLRHWVIGCDAIATFADNDQFYKNIINGPLSNTCNNIH